MSQYILGIEVHESDFPELGHPMRPDKTKLKSVPRDYKDDYKGYIQSCNVGMPTAESRFGAHPNQSNKPISIISDSFIKIEFDYEKETSKTYKFMGMDIDEDFNAIIKLGEGHVIVGHMFDRDTVREFINATRYFGRNSSYTQDEKDVLININQTIREETIRKIVTSLKTGSIYSMIKEASGEYGYTDFSQSFFKSFINDIGGKSSTSSENTNMTSSIILNLVNLEEIEKMERKGVSVDSEGILEKIKFYISTLFMYWSALIDVYCGAVTQLASLDLWSMFNKKAIGDNEFNRRMSNCIDIMDTSTGAIEDGIVSFAGISKNGGVSDQNMIRERSSKSAEYLCNVLRGFTSAGNEITTNLDNLLMSMIDEDDIEDIYSLTEEEIQALSVLDSLRYTDEEAAVSKESYDMNDPDERGLFVKSAIRSYERNFKEFKPAENYEVTQALAELVERGDIESNKQVSIENLTADMNDLDMGDIVTLSGSDFKVKADIQSLKRVMKMVNKFSKEVLAGI